MNGSRCQLTSFVLLVLTSLWSVAPAAVAQQSTAAATNLPALTMLAKIAAAGTAQQYDQSEQFFAQGKAAGLSEVQMYEAVLNLLPYIGYPRTLNTMSRFQKVYPRYIQDRADGQGPQPTEPWPQYAVKVWGERGEKIRQQLGVGGPGAEELTRQLTLLSPELVEWVMYDDFGRIFGRAGLSLLEREVIVVGALIAQGVPQVAVHYKALLRVGGNDALVDAVFEAVSGIVEEKALTTARQYLGEARQQ
jgi:4-carboxymuconolactone decarboxylase